MGRDHSHQFFLYNHANRRFTEIADGFTCGRTSGDYQFFSDELVSKLQCRFKIKRNQVFVEDLGSTNPTRVNSVALTPGRARKLYLNDVIEFGHTYLVLTNQQSTAPANIRDRTEKAGFRAVKRKTGGLSSNMTGSRSFTKTLVRLSEKSYRMLKIKEFQEVRNWDASTSLTGISVFLSWAIALYFAYESGAFGTLSSSTEILSVAEQTLIGFALSVFATFLHSFFVRRSVKSTLKRMLFIPVWVSLSALMVVWGLFMTNLFAQPEMNVIRRHCLERFQFDLCQKFAQKDLPGYTALTTEERRQIRDRIEEQGPTDHSSSVRSGAP